MKGSSGVSRGAAFWAACSALVLGVRLCHVKVLWVDEAYGLAAARRMLEGAALYRDIWFDKPPLYAWIYLAWGAETGWPLRLAGALFALLCCWLAGRVAATLFGPREGWYAAAGMAFFLSFDHPVAVLSLAPDLLLIPFALGAVWAMAANRPVLAAACAAAGLLANAKALLLLPLILFWPGAVRRECRPVSAQPAKWGLARISLLLRNFVPVPDFARQQSCSSGSAPHYIRAWKKILPAYALAAAAVWLAAGGWGEPVWEWGALYSRDSFVANPVWEGLKRTANWAGFHAALVVFAAIYFTRKEAQRRRLAVWLALGLVMAAAGARFFPRYYLALLPVLVVAAARGVCLAPRRLRAVLLAIALAVPAVRFGGRHIATLRADPSAMRDLALWEDCRQAAAKIHSLAHPGDTLLVWGYRPELNVLAGLRGATRFLDSQPLTGVLADRHLSDARPTAPSLARRHRGQLIGTRPTFIADGLGPYNPALAIARYEDLRPWFSQYELVGETRGTRIYRRR